MSLFHDLQIQQRPGCHERINAIVIFLFLPWGEIKFEICLQLTKLQI